MADLHLRVLREVVRARRKKLLVAKHTAAPQAGARRLRQAKDAQARARAQLAAASARRVLGKRSGPARDGQQP
jgi:hypothetical protein